MTKNRIEVLKYAIKNTTSSATAIVLQQELDELLARQEQKEDHSQPQYIVKDRDGKIHGSFDTEEEALIKLQRIQGQSYDHATKYEGWKIERVNLIPVKSVTITRGEGPSHLCRKPETVDTLKEASEVLKRWSTTAPKGGCYDKCNFVITFADGDTYTGRYDLKHYTEETPNVKKHVKDFLEFYGLIRRPLWMNDKQWNRHVEREKGEREQEALKFYNTYNVH